MKLYAVTMMKDEEDVADLVLYHLASQGVDGIIVADNMSTDSTSDKLHEAKKNLDIEVIIQNFNMMIEQPALVEPVVEGQVQLPGAEGQEPALLEQPQ